MTDRVALGGLRAPGLARRLACFLYEGVLLFGLLMVAGLAYAIVTNQRHALVGAWGLKAFLFLVLGGYFVWFWSRHGQTLAMRTWHIRLLTRAGQPVARWRAVCRYLLAWLWFIPALVLVQVSGLTGAALAFSAVAAGVLAYAGLAWLRPDRQFWHDVACGTQLVTWRTAPPANEKAP